MRLGHSNRDRYAFEHRTPKCEVGQRHVFQSHKIEERAINSNLQAKTCSQRSGKYSPDPDKRMPGIYNGSASTKPRHLWLTLRDCTMRFGDGAIDVVIPCDWNSVVVYIVDFPLPYCFFIQQQFSVSVTASVSYLDNSNFIGLFPYHSRWLPH